MIKLFLMKNKLFLMKNKLFLMKNNLDMMTNGCYIRKKRIITWARKN